MSPARTIACTSPSVTTVRSGVSGSAAAFAVDGTHNSNATVIWNAIEAKTVRYPDGASVMEHLLKSKGSEFGFGAMTEIVLYRDKGLKLVGPLPADVQNYTSYTAALTPTGKASPAARELVAYLGTADARKALADNGVQ